MRSLAEARRTLERQGRELLFGEGGLPTGAMSAGASLQNVWDPTTRGDTLTGALEFEVPEGFTELPYPLRYRPFVEAYRRALKDLLKGRRSP